MLTRLIAKNFKQFEEVDIDLSSAVVFIGPNNSGKTTALQALALWEAGCKQWLAKRAQGAASDAAKGVTIVRKGLVAVPVPTTNALWRNLRVREGYREQDRTKTRNILIEITVHGEGDQGAWECGFEFEYASEEFFYCRPIRLDEAKKPKRLGVPVPAIEAVNLGFLPPMTGLVMEEALLQPGRINVLLGSGRSGETLRNLCYSVHQANPEKWDEIVAYMNDLFGATLRVPTFVSQTGTIDVEYENQAGAILPLTSAGLGMLQTLLLLVHLQLKPKQVLLLDEPDAHLEILRQRQIYQVLVELANQQESQLICASHSEVVLNEAIARDTVVAFVGKPHVVSGNQSSQVLKALKDIGFEHYIQAIQTGWVLYLEGSTDLAILRAWAEKLGHPAKAALAKPYVHYLNTNVPSIARAHFNAIKEANQAVLGLAIFDRLEKPVQGVQDGLMDVEWGRREIENYFANPKVLLAFAGSPIVSMDLFEATDLPDRVRAMKESIHDVEQATMTLGEDLWSQSRKASDQVLPQIFKRYLSKTSDVRVPHSKGEFYKLIAYQDPNDIDKEVLDVLDRISEIFQRVASNGR
jgi:ABC-type taurine transport system ATPase subunit